MACCCVVFCHLYQDCSFLLFFEKRRAVGGKTITEVKPPLCSSFVFLPRSAPTNDFPLTPVERQTSKANFNQHCLQCHGIALERVDFEPPLNHPCYVPSHRGTI